MRYALGLADDGEWVAASANDAGAERRLVLRGDVGRNRPGDRAAALVSQTTALLGDPEALAFAHRDELDAPGVAELRSALDAAGLSSCRLIRASIALSFDRDPAVGAAIWAWRSAGGGSSVRGALAGGAVAGAGAAAASAPTGAGAIPATGQTMADFAGTGSNMGDFGTGSSMRDFDSGRTLEDFGDGRQMSDFGAGEPPPPSSSAEVTSEPAPKRVPGRALASAAIAAVVVVGAGTAVALTRGGDDERITSAAKTSEATARPSLTSTSVVDTSRLWVGTISYLEATPEDGHIRATWSVEAESAGEPELLDRQQTIQSAEWLIDVAYDFTVERNGCTVRHQANETLNGTGVADIIHYGPGTRSDGFLGWEARVSASDPAQGYTEELTETCNGQTTSSERELNVNPDVFLTLPGEDPQRDELMITEDPSDDSNGLDFGSGPLTRTEFSVIRRGSDPG